MRLIITESPQRLQPQFLLSKLDLLSYDLQKHDVAYVFLDSLENIELLFDMPNVVLVSSEDVVLRDDWDLEIEKRDYRVRDVDIRDKMMKSDVIRKYIWG